MSSTEEDLKARLFELLMRFSVEKSEVTLASGQKSSIYFDCRQVYFRGEAQFILGELLFKEMLKIERSSGVAFSAIGGMAMGSIPLSCAISAAAFRRGRELPGFAVRKDAKDHGMLHTIEGSKSLVPHQQVVVVEDVVTTASSVKNAILKLRQQNIKVDSVLAIIDREQGGQAILEAIDVRLYSLFTLKDFSEKNTGF